MGQFLRKNGVVTVMRELASIEENYLVKEEKFIWDNRWLITLKPETKGKIIRKALWVIRS